MSRKSSSSSNGSVDLNTNSNKSSRKGKSSSSDQLLRHDEHSIKSVRAKIAMFSTQKSVESIQDTSANVNNSNTSAILRSTPSPVGNGGRNSLSAHPTSRVLTSTSSTSTPSSSVPPSSKKFNPDLESKVGMPYHRSMINVSSDSPDIGVGQSQSIVSEKSQSHADLTKSNELSGYKNQKLNLTRVNSTENAGADIRLRARGLHQYNVENTQHGRSQSLLEIDSNNMVLRESSNNDDPSTELFKSNNNMKATIASKKIVSDRSQSSSALIIAPSLLDESDSSKSNLIHTRRRHTLTKLKGIAIPENDLSSTISTGNQQLKNGKQLDTNKQKPVLSTPPWKGGLSESSNGSISKYSPAFKRKPFTVYSTGNIKPPTPKQSSQTNISQELQNNGDKRSSQNPLPTGKNSSARTNKRSSKDVTDKPITNTSRRSNPAVVSKIDIDSDNDSAVSSARSSLSHGSGSACVSPPSSPPLVACDKTDGENSLDCRPDITPNILARKDVPLSNSSATLNGNDQKNSCNLATDKNPRVLKKHSVEAINRRNILESCKKSSAKDTIVEPSIESKPKIADMNSTSTTTALSTSTEPIQKAVNSPNYDIASTNTSRTSVALAKERRSISSSSRATSFPLGKPASRSSSFTIAERKKSFEALTKSQAEAISNRRSSKPLDSRLSSAHQLHSSQDSLANTRTGSTSLMHPANIKSYSCVSSRRSSRDEPPVSSTSSLSLKTAATESSLMESNILSMKRSSLSSSSSKNISSTNSHTNSSSRIENTASLTKDGDPINDLGKASRDCGTKEEQGASKCGPTIISRTNSVTSDKSGRSAHKENKSNVSTPTNPQVLDENRKWSTLEKKWSSTMDKSGNKIVIQSGDTKNKIAQFAMNSDKNNLMDGNKSLERPRDLSFSSSFSGQANSKMSPGSGTVTPSVKNIKEMAEKWEVRSNSVDSSSLITPTNSSTATTPTPSLSFSRRSTQDKLLTPMTNTPLNSELSSNSNKVMTYDKGIYFSRIYKCL